MNITVGIVTSFIVGGLLLVALLNLNIRIMQNSADLTADQVVKQKVQTVRELVEHDFMKAGFLEGGQIAFGQRVTEAATNRITFRTDLNRDGAAETLTWFFDTSTPVSETMNPNDYLLIRDHDGDETEIKQGVTSFSLTYYTPEGKRIESPFDSNAATDSLRYIKKIKVALICQSAESIDRNKAAGTPTYAKSFWQKTITPWNL